MPVRSRPYTIGLNKRLRDPTHAAAYLNAAEKEGRDVFRLALRDVVKAHKVSKIASAAKVNRVSLYRSLSARGNPSDSTVKEILYAIGIENEYRPRIRRKGSTPSGSRVQIDSIGGSSINCVILDLQSLGALNPARDLIRVPSPSPYHGVSMQDLAVAAAADNKFASSQGH